MRERLEAIGIQVLNKIFRAIAVCAEALPGRGDRRPPTD